MIRRTLIDIDVCLKSKKNIVLVFMQLISIRSRGKLISNFCWLLRKCKCSSLVEMRFEIKRRVAFCSDFYLFTEQRSIKSLPSLPRSDRLRLEVPHDDLRLRCHPSFCCGQISSFLLCIPRCSARGQSVVYC